MSDLGRCKTSEPERNYAGQRRTLSSHRDRTLGGGWHKWRDKNLQVRHFLERNSISKCQKHSETAKGEFTPIAYAAGRPSSLLTHRYHPHRVAHAMYSWQGRLHACIARIQDAGLTVTC